MSHTVLPGPATSELIQLPIPKAIKVSYEMELWRRGYRSRTIAQYLAGIERFDRWIKAERIPEAVVSDPLVRRFLASIDSQSMKYHRAALAKLLSIVETRSESAIVPTIAGLEDSLLEQTMERFYSHLRDVHGLAENTCDQRQRLVRHAMEELRPSGRALSAVQSTDLIQFFTRYGKAHKPGSTRVLATAIRSYFRFEQMQGRDLAHLIAAIPTIANWRNMALPETLSEEQLARFFAAFDRTTASGQRDYAMARCLVDLGLRASEVAHMQLENINWRDGRLDLPGTKSRRTDTLPLPRLTGTALAEYLQNGRQPTSSRLVFLRHYAPDDAPTTAGIVRGAMRRAYARAGLPTEWTGTHRLRHTAATRMLQGGAPIKAIADVLRHRTLNTTMNYTRVDLQQLRTVSMPWPGAAS